MKISPICRKCDADLSSKELERIRNQIMDLSYGKEHLDRDRGTWHGVCDKCKDEPFVVS